MEFVKNLIVFLSITFIINFSQASDFHTIEYRCSNGQNYLAIASKEARHVFDQTKLYRLYSFCNSSHVTEPNQPSPEDRNRCHKDITQDSYHCYAEFKFLDNMIQLSRDTLIKDQMGISHGRSISEPISQLKTGIDPRAIKVFHSFKKQIKANCLEPAKIYGGLNAEAITLNEKQFEKLFIMAMNRPKRRPNSNHFHATACSALIKTQVQRFEMFQGFSKLLVGN